MAITIGFSFILPILIVIVCRFIVLLKWEERKLVSRLVKAEPEERDKILRRRCWELVVKMEGKDMDLGKKGPWFFKLLGIYVEDLRRKSVEKGDLLGDEEMERMEKGPLI